MNRENDPQHYKETSFKCIDAIMMVLGAGGTVTFCIGNVIKYLWRYKHKNGLEDLEKASEYVNIAQDIINRHLHGEDAERYQDELDRVAVVHGYIFRKEKMNDQRGVL